MVIMYPNFMSKVQSRVHLHRTLRPNCMPWKGSTVGKNKYMLLQLYANNFAQRSQVEQGFRAKLSFQHDSSNRLGSEYYIFFLRNHRKPNNIRSPADQRHTTCVTEVTAGRKKIQDGARPTEYWQRPGKRNKTP